MTLFTLRIHNFWGTIGHEQIAYVDLRWAEMDINKQPTTIKRWVKT
jgi:hypothetical protein